MKDIELNVFIRIRSDEATADQMAREVKCVLDNWLCTDGSGNPSEDISAIHVRNPETNLVLT